MSGNPDRDFEINTSNNINNINNINNVNNPVISAEPKHPPVHFVRVPRHAPSTRYKVHTRTKVQRKVGDYLRLMERLDPEHGYLAARLKERYQKYLTDLNQYTKEDPGTRRPSPLTQGGVRQLQEDLAGIYQLSSKYLQMVDRRMRDPEAPKYGETAMFYTNAVRNIEEAVAKDYRTLQSLHPDGVTTLPELVKSSRKRTLRVSSNVRTQDIQKVGCAMSKRMLMSVATVDGIEQRGVFTQSVNVDYDKTVTDFIKKEKEQYSVYFTDKNFREKDRKALLEYYGFFDYMEKKRKEAEKRDDCRYSIGQFYAIAFDENKNKDGVTFITPNAYIRDGIGKYENNSYYKTFLSTFKDDYKHISAQYHMYHGRHRLEEGDTIDRRNSAMTDVAELLGHGDLIARSTPVSMKLPDGKTVKGTFMNFAEGTDIGHTKLNDPYFSTKPEDFSNTVGLKSVADLQVLDFICGNTDRHLKNMLYRFDDNGKFIGVKGIDNDMSFGVLPNQGIDGKNGYLAAIDDLHVISESMATRVQELSPTTLAMALHSHGLRDEEVGDAVIRLGMLQRYINGQSLPGRGNRPLRIVKDGEWEDINLSDLTNGAVKRRGIFNVLNETAHSQVAMFQENVQRLQNENAMFAGVTLKSRLHEKADVDFDELAGRMDKLGEMFTYLNMDDLNGPDAKKEMEGLRQFIDQASIDFKALKDEPPKVTEYTEEELANKMLTLNASANVLKRTPHPTKAQKAELEKLKATIVRYDNAIWNADENGICRVTETDEERRARHKDTAERYMQGLRALSGHYIDTWKDKEPPLDPDEKNPEIIAKKTAHLKSVDDAVNLAYAMAQVAETGFQKQKESYRFAGGAEEQPKEDYTSLADKMSGFVEKLENAEKNVHFGSKEYDNMKQYALFMRDQLKEMAKTPAPSDPGQAETLQDERFERTQTMMSTMQALSEMYLQHRDNKNESSLSAKTQKRIVAASELNVFAKSNCEKFREQSFDDLYRDGLAQERENAFANMKPKQIGTYIKNIIRMANAHKDDPLFVNTAQTELSKYMRLVKNQTAQEVGLSKNDVRDLNKFNKEHPIAPPKDTKKKTKEKTELDGTEMKETNPEFKEDGNSRHSSRTPSISITG